MVERCLDTAEVWGSNPHAPTKLARDSHVSCFDRIYMMNTIHM